MKELTYGKIAIICMVVQVLLITLKLVSVINVHWLIVLIPLFMLMIGTAVIISIVIKAIYELLNQTEFQIMLEEGSEEI